ncbi:MAG: biotin transporter BioY [Clostridia bacterium]|nr:biotin transporter BioY [Clostridia bacterium]
MKKINKKLAAVDIAECALFAALMVVGAYIKIPFPLVPLTFQTVICVLSGLMLGWKKAGIAMGVYCIMGLIGIPVFASEPYGGFSYVLKPSFGYILGFILAAVCAGLVRGSNTKVPLWRYFVAAAAAFIANYAVGIVYFIAVWQLNGYEGLGSAVVTYNLLYMPKDIVLCALAAVLAWKVVPVIYKGKNKLKQPEKHPAAAAADETAPADAAADTTDIID